MEFWAAVGHWWKTDKRSGRYSSSLLGSVFFFRGLMSSGVNETVPVSLETVERLCLGSSLPAGSASAILIRELTACLATTRTISCQILRATGSGRSGKPVYVRTWRKPSPVFAVKTRKNILIWRLCVLLDAVSFSYARYAGLYFRCTYFC